MNNNQKHPPRWADRFLEWFCHPDLLEDVQGDMHELFQKRITRVGPIKAKWQFVWDVIRAFRPSSFKKITINIHPIMFRNYLKTAWRNLLRNKQSTFINIAGLAIGIACFLVIFFHLKDELSYDQHFANKDRIFRVTEDRTSKEGILSKKASTNAPLAPVLQQNLPGLEQVIRLYRQEGQFWKEEEQLGGGQKPQQYIEDRFFYADSTFFEVFDHEFIAGDPDQALQKPFNMVLTETIAKKYFGTVNPIGKVIKYKDNREIYDFTVTGVLKNPKENTHFNFDLLVSFSSIKRVNSWYFNWHHPDMHTYVLLEVGVDPQHLQTQLSALPAELMKPEDAKRFDWRLQALTDIHLHSHLQNELQANGHITYVYTFMAIAFFILLIACINFMNLATSSSTTRAKEIGVRKTLGAQRSQLVQQFLGESLILVVISFVLAIFIVELSVPYFGEMLGKNLTSHYLDHWSTPTILISLIIGVSLLSGLYPAFFLSSFRPTSVLKGLNLKLDFGNLMIRKGLVVFQFFISCALIVATLIMYNQIQYMQNKDLGFEKDQIITVLLRDTENQISYKPIKDKWLQHPNVLNVAASSGVPTTEGIHDFQVKPKETAAYDSLEHLILTVDEDFSETYNLQFVVGRDFSKDHPTDASGAFILNESAVKLLGWENPIGKELNMTYYFRGEVEKTGRVIGVVKDFNYNSLHQAVDPLLLHMAPNTYYNDYLSLKIHPENVSETLAFLEKEWIAFNPDRPFEYQFLDETFAKLYESESRLNQLFMFFSLLAVIIACLGLFALASFTCERRTKEIGVRKILGASTSNIVLMLSNQFTRLVLLAFLLSIPLSWFALQRWLENFAYQTKVGWGIFLLAGGLAIAIAFLTISYHTLKVALANPVKALRYE